MTQSVSTGARLPRLDGMRGLAVLMVVLCHARSVLYLQESPLRYLARPLAHGGSGVDLFFVLSGFLISGILIEDKESPRYYSTFYARRTLRIFPLYYAVLVLWFGAFPLLWPALREKVWQPHNQVWFWLYIQNWAQAFGKDVGYLSHFWSLAIEEQFYLLWPLIVRTLSVRKLGRLCVALFIGCLVTRAIGLSLGVPERFFERFTLVRVDALALGSFVAIVVRDARLKARFLAIKQTLVVAFGAIAVVCLVVTRGLDSRSQLWHVVGHAVWASGYALLLLHAVTSIGRAGWGLRLLEAPLLRKFGKFSYAMYVLHYPIHRAFLDFVFPSAYVKPLSTTTWFALGYLVALVVISYGAALISWQILEGPMLSFKERFAPRVATEPQEAIPASPSGAS